MLVAKLITFVVFFTICICHEGPYPDDSFCEGQEDYHYLDPKDPCSCWCLDEKVYCPPCYDPTTNDVIPYCQDQEDHQLNPSDPCSCWCINQELVCNECIIDVETTTVDGCVGNTEYPIDPNDPCSCWCVDGWLTCPTCTTDTDTTTEPTTSGNICEGQEDHAIDPSDPCSCWCLGGWLACPTCTTSAETETTPELKIQYKSREENFIFIISDNVCEGQPDHIIDPSDPCSCFCIEGWLACPECTTITTTESPTTIEE